MSIQPTATHPQPRFFAWLMSGPAALLIIALMIYPLANLVWLSLHDYRASTLVGEWVGLKWYAALPADPRFMAGLGRTLAYSASAVVVSLVIGTLMAFILNRNFPGVTLVRTIFILPMVSMPVASALMWGTLFNPNQGVFNFFLESLGWERSLWLAHPNTALLSLVIVEVWMGAPFVMLIVLAGLRSMPTEPIEAARIDGASPLQMLLFVTFPMLRSALATAILFQLIDTLKQFPLIWVLTQGGPLRSTETLYVYGYNLAFQSFDIGYGAAVLMALLVLVLFISALWMRVRERSWV
jgi:multiple sugar transport system permease protein